MAKALGLMSGGLDSTLAAMTLMRQGVEVVGISFETPFFNADKAKSAAQQIGYPLIVKDIGEVHLEVLKKPKYGYGRNMNPCIDCHALMFRLAGEMMQEQGFDFLFSGEVLGQRPMSQNANALRSVANHSGYPDKVLRPLSAKLLPETPMEIAGLVDREQLLDIQGRSRKPQQAYAREWGYLDFPSSAGGCLLTEVGFSNRLRDQLTHNPASTVVDMELLKVGRQFRLSDRSKLILGRNRADNDALNQVLQDSGMRLRCRDFSGPLGVLRGCPDDADRLKAAGIVASYGKGKDEAAVEVLFFGDGQEFCLNVAPTPREICMQAILS